MRDDPVIDEIRERAGAALQVVSAERIDGLARSDAPQGVVAMAAPLRAADLDELLGAPGAFVVALDGVSDPRNLGAVARAAETAGVTGLVLPKHRSARVTPVVAKAAAGRDRAPADRAERHPDRARARRTRGVLDASASTRAAIGACSISSSPTNRSCSCSGRKARVSSRLTRARCDVLVSIPMRGADRVAQRRRRGRGRLSRDRAPPGGTTIVIPSPG